MCKLPVACCWPAGPQQAQPGPSGRPHPLPGAAAQPPQPPGRTPSPQKPRLPPPRSSFPELEEISNVDLATALTDEGAYAQLLQRVKEGGGGASQGPQPSEVRRGGLCDFLAGRGKCRAVWYVVSGRLFVAGPAQRPQGGSCEVKCWAAHSPPFAEHL